MVARTTAGGGEAARDAAPRREEVAGAPARGPDPDGLPDHLREPPAARHLWDFPTAWLFGAQLASSLSDIMLSSIFELDPRDWMTAGPPVDLGSALRAGPDGEPECWIDFIADTGDSPRLVYQLAYLLQQRELAPIDRDGRPITVGGIPRALPRGAALVIGGDTAYPIATEQRLIERFRAPFIWARRRLGDRAAPRDERIALLGIPGNHDYYNVLHGYQRQFRAPATAPGTTPGGSPAAAGKPARLDIPGFELRQEASYFAVTLPCGWQLWGLDIERDALDDRQRAYFRELAAREPCRSRIVITSRPAVVYHGRGEHAEVVGAALDQLGLARAFEDPAKLPAGELRLDLSGDDHVYERYWGSDSDTPVVSRSESATLDDGAYPKRKPIGNETATPGVTPVHARYASVVSGLGGAFHHPSQLRFGDQAPRSSWPPVDDSSRAIGERLIRPRKVFQAGAVGIVGMVVGVLCFLLVQLADSKHNVLDVPLAMAGCSSAMLTSLAHLGIVAAIIATIVAMGVVLWLCVGWMKRLARPLYADTAPTGWWPRATHWLSHNRFAFWCLRWIGGNRRTHWGILITAPAWLLLLPIPVAAWFALHSCPHLAAAKDGYAPLYTIAVLLMFAMFAVGALVGGHRHSLGVRLAIGGFGALIGALMMWTPYGWTRLGTLGDERSLLVLLFFGYWLFHKGVIRIGLMRWPIRLRRAASTAAFLFIACSFVAIPHLFVPIAELSTPPPWYALPLGAFFGGYFSCLWLGWYLFVCLQWNVHGYQAGGTARVVEFAELLRIRLTANAAEVWVISPSSPRPSAGHSRWWQLTPRWKFWKTIAAEDHPIEPKLVDHFRIERDAR